MKRGNHGQRGFTLVELSIGLVIIGLLVGAILGGVQMIGNAKIRRQVKDLQGLNAAVYTYYDKFQKLPGDANANGAFDSDSLVWVNLQSENLAQKVKTSPFGAAYSFGFADSTLVSTTHRQGNYISVTLPRDVAKNIDTQVDDATYDSGTFTADRDYTGTGRVTVYFFLD